MAQTKQSTITFFLPASLKKRVQKAVKASITGISMTAWLKDAIVDKLKKDD